MPSSTLGVLAVAHRLRRLPARRPAQSELREWVSCWLEHIDHQTRLPPRLHSSAPLVSVCVFPLESPRRVQLVLTCQLASGPSAASRSARRLEPRPPSTRRPCTHPVVSVLDSRPAFRFMQPRAACSAAFARLARPSVSFGGLARHSRPPARSSPTGELLRSFGSTPEARRQRFSPLPTKAPLASALTAAKVDGKAAAARAQYEEVIHKYAVSGARRDGELVLRCAPNPRRSVPRARTPLSRELTVVGDPDRSTAPAQARSLTGTARSAGSNSRSRTSARLTGSTCVPH